MLIRLKLFYANNKPKQDISVETNGMETLMSNMFTDVITSINLELFQFNNNAYFMHCIYPLF